MNITNDEWAAGDFNSENSDGAPIINHEMRFNFFQPWSTFVMQTQLPSKILEKMIRITDEVVANEERKDQGAGQLKDQFSITPKRLEQENLMSFFLDVCKTFIIQAFYQAKPFNKENIKNEEWLPYLRSMWINSQKDNEYFPVHYHMACTISSVMYLKIPEYLPSRKVRSTQKEQDGNLTFTKTGETNKIWGWPLLEIQPQIGDLFIFPSEQLHQVYPFRTADGKGERRSVSFNAIFSSMSAQEHMTEPKQENI